MQKDVFDVMLGDIRAARVRKASFSGLIQTEHQVEKVVKSLKISKGLMELDLSWCYFGENEMSTNVLFSRETVAV